jgi:general secretion pathway protein G
LTIVELLVAMAVIATLAAIAVPNYKAYTEKSRTATAIADIHSIVLQITLYRAETGDFPMSLDEVGAGSKLDPWGNPYQYLNIAATQGKGKVRKDHNLVPINSDYDLYSMGKDGESQSPLTAKASRDDIIRANDGGYIGLASRY